MAEVPTVRVEVKATGVECVINESEFDAKLHTKLEQAKKAKPYDPRARR